VLLDEPAAGLDTDESRRLGDRLRQVVESGVTILLVDHDMGLVLSVCDHLYVLDFGRLIAAGPPATIRGDEQVIAAYLGGGPVGAEASP
jgi:branched-chain amino acid transport system ATP-binding protein